MNYRDAIQKTLALIEQRREVYGRERGQWSQIRNDELSWAKDTLQHYLKCADHPIIVVQAAALDLGTLISQLIEKRTDGLATINADDTAKKLQDIRDHLVDVTR